jgi:polysaccharide export outer membrane protein
VARRTALVRGLALIRSLALGLGLCGILEAAGCATPGEGLPAVPDPASGVYRLGPGDQVRIIVFGDEQLTGEFRVDASGDIGLPLMGSVHAAELTTRQLERAVAAALERRQLYNKPSVAAEVTSYRPVFILGEVARPGQYAFQPGMTVMTAAAVGGGFTYRAVDDVFSIVRTENGKAVEGRAGRQTFVQPGDVITVYERRF